MSRIGKKKQLGAKEKKKELAKQKGDQGDKTREDIGMERGLDSSSMEEQTNISQMPTKMEMMKMFVKLENSMKSEISVVSVDMGHLWRRVEEAEEKTEKQSQEILELKNASKEIAN